MNLFPKTVIRDSYQPSEIYGIEGNHEPSLAEHFERVDAQLYELIDSAGHGAVEVKLIFSDPLELPYFYDRDPRQPSDSYYNQSIREKNESLALAIREARRPIYEHFTEIVENELAGQVIYESMLTQSMIIEIPHESIKEAINLTGIERIELVEKGVIPPTIQAGRSLIGSDSYYSEYGRAVYLPIALLDTGVRTSHVLLSGVIDENYDCSTSASTCVPVTTWSDPCNHGTRSASIIAGNSSMGNPYRGMTKGYINSYNVFDAVPFPCPGSTTFYNRGMDQAVIDGNKVIVSEVQFSSTSANNQADSAFDTGRIVIAAAGNHPHPSAGSVSSPASAHKVLGVGAVDLGGALYSEQRLGPTTDGRVKPDIQGVTGTWTASAASNTATIRYPGTSGATPYAAGAAALISRRLQKRFGIYDPGHTYAHMIAFGSRDISDSFTRNTYGAGLIQMPPLDAPFTLGKFTVGGGQTLTLNAPAVPTASSGLTYQQIRSAIWWPKNSSAPHKNIHLTLKNPAGVAVTSSTVNGSVFQKVIGNAPLSTGVYTLEITNTSGTTQQVYFATYLIP